eukprot:364722-Chlamydomonas_euryale.AAC.7
MVEVPSHLLDQVRGSSASIVLALCVDLRTWGLCGACNNQQLCFSDPVTLTRVQIQARLQERRILIEREVLKYGEAPAGIKEVFELCRGFERAYVEFINASPGSQAACCTISVHAVQRTSRDCFRAACGCARAGNIGATLCRLSLYGCACSGLPSADHAGLACVHAL